MNQGPVSQTANLLQQNDPPVVWTTGQQAGSDFLLLCDHAGRSIPQRLGQLGLSTAELDRHIACDIGVENLGRELAVLLDACCIGQRYSRLVIDCNRYPEDAESIVERSDGTTIPGNQKLAVEERMQRRREIFDPYHAHIAGEIADRTARGQASWLILLHSFTPVWNGWARPWQIGVLSHRDRRLAQASLDELQEQAASDLQLIIGDNQPYTSTDGSDYALNHYGERLGLLHVEIEVRQDLIADAKGQQLWAARLAQVLMRARARLIDID